MGEREGTYSAWRPGGSPVLAWCRAMACACSGPIPSDPALVPVLSGPALVPVLSGPALVPVLSDPALVPVLSGPALVPVLNDGCCAFDFVVVVVAVIGVIDGDVFAPFVVAVLVVLAGVVCCCSPNLSKCSDMMLPNSRKKASTSGSPWYLF